MGPYLLHFAATVLTPHLPHFTTTACYPEQYGASPAHLLHFTTTVPTCPDSDIYHTLQLLPATLNNKGPALHIYHTLQLLPVTLNKGPATTGAAALCPTATRPLGSVTTAPRGGQSRRRGQPINLVLLTSTLLQAGYARKPPPVLCPATVCPLPRRPDRSFATLES